MSNVTIKTDIPERESELRDMKTYWDVCASENAMRHIAVDHGENEDVFHSSGERDIDRILGFLNGDILKSSRYRVLEVGCGIGRLLMPLALRYPSWDIYGVDVSDEMIRKAGKRLEEFGNIKLFSNNGKDLGMFEDAFFHIVFSYIVFQHIPRKFVRSYFKEISRKLVDKGLFIFQLPIYPLNVKIEEPPDSDFRTVRHYSVNEIATLCTSNHMRIVKAVPINAGGNYSPSAWFIVIKD